MTPDWGEDPLKSNGHDKRTQCHKAQSETATRPATKGHCFHAASGCRQQVYSARSSEGEVGVQRREEPCLTKPGGLPTLSLTWSPTGEKGLLSSLHDPPPTTPEGQEGVVGRELPQRWQPGTTISPPTANSSCTFLFLNKHTHTPSKFSIIVLLCQWQRMGVEQRPDQGRGAGITPSSGDQAPKRIGRLRPETRRDGLPQHGLQPGRGHSPQEGWP